jgi:hypothetical protein
VELHAAVGDRLEQAPGASRGNENRGGWNKPERGQMGVVSVEVGDQDDVGLRSPPRRNSTTDSTEMAQASCQHWVEQHGRAPVLPRTRAVPPPCQDGRHSAARPPDDGELDRSTVSQAIRRRCTFPRSVQRIAVIRHANRWVPGHGCLHPASLRGSGPMPMHDQIRVSLARQRCGW